MMNNRSQVPRLAEEYREEFQGISSNQEDFAYYTKKSHERSRVEKCHRMPCNDERLNVISGHVSDYFNQRPSQTGIEIEQSRSQTGIQIEHDRLKTRQNESDRSCNDEQCQERLSVIKERKRELQKRENLLE